MDDKQSLLTQTQLRFIKSLGGRNLSIHTATAYQTDIRQFLTWLMENDMTVDSPTQITRTHILDYLSHLAGLGRSGVTRARKLAAIREYCKFLVDEQIIPASPTEHIVRPKKERKQRVFLRVDEYMCLLNSLKFPSCSKGSTFSFLFVGLVRLREDIFSWVGLISASYFPVPSKRVDISGGFRLVRQRSLFVDDNAGNNTSSPLSSLMSVMKPL
jgi:hypothetical protein